MTMSSKNQPIPTFDMERTATAHLLFVGLFIKHEPDSIQAGIAKMCRAELFRRPPGFKPDSLEDESTT